MTRRDAGRLIALGGLGLMWSSPCALTHTQSQSPRPSNPEPLDVILQRIREIHRLPGLATAVIHKGKVVASGVSGVRQQGAIDRITINDRFHIASCTKSLTAMLAAVAVQNGRLRWNTSLADRLPELAAKIRSEYRSATLEQLLAHEARMPAFTQPTIQQVAQMRALKGTHVQQRLAFLADVLRTEEPNQGTGDASYSNVGYAAAGAMIERAAGISWETLVTRELAQPLGMKDVGFGYPATAETADRPRGHSERNGRIIELPLDESRQLPVCLWPAGAIHCSIGDLALYAADHLNGLRARPALLSAELYERLHRPLRSGSVFALGWGVVVDKRWGTTHFGAGSGGWFFARIMIVPEHDAAVVVLSNSGQAGTATTELITLLLERFAANKV